MIKNKISGETLARLLNTLQTANIEQLDEQSLCDRLSSELKKVEDLYINNFSTTQQGVFNFTNLNLSRLSLLDDSLVDKLNVMLPWSSISEVGIDKRIGSAWSNRKRAGVAQFPDPVIKELNRHLPLQDMNVLEAGCFEGHHTCSLAVLAKSVVAFDGRIENTIKTLVHCWLMGLEQQVRIECIDIEKYTIADTLTKLGISDRIDLIHHRGVLYHLSDPCRHLQDLAKISSKHIYLHTQIATKEQAKDIYKTAFGELNAFFYREPKVEFSPFAGLTSTAIWLTKDDLCNVLKAIGFNHIEILSEKIERNGARIELIASRP
jgi:tRNA (mo5U34)-methyltransferase